MERTLKSRHPGRSATARRAVTQAQRTALLGPGSRLRPVRDDAENNRAGAGNPAPHKNSGGTIMSLKKSVTRRLSLLAGSSLTAGTIAAAVAFSGTALTPGAALAANECAPIG